MCLVTRQIKPILTKKDIIVYKKLRKGKYPYYIGAARQKILSLVNHLLIWLKIVRVGYNVLINNNYVY